MKVRLSGNARKYLLQETAYLRKPSPAAAEAFVDRMAKARQNLGRFPHAGIGPERLPIPDAQCLVASDYLIDYDILSDGILITSVRHGTMRPPATSAEDDFDYET